MVKLKLSRTSSLNITETQIKFNYQFMFKWQLMDYGVTAVRVILIVNSIPYYEFKIFKYTIFVYLVGKCYTRYHGGFKDKRCKVKVNHFLNGQFTPPPPFILLLFFQILGTAYNALLYRPQCSKCGRL